MNTNKQETEIITGTGDIDTKTEGQSSTSTNILPPLEPPTGAPLFDPSTPYEKAIADYLESNAPDTLKRKIREAKAAGYGIRDCLKCITEQARKYAKNGCAMIADDVVYGWAVHYFEDEWQTAAKRRAEAKAGADAAKSQSNTTAKSSKATKQTTKKSAHKSSDADPQKTNVVQGSLFNGLFN